MSESRLVSKAEFDSMKIEDEDKFESRNILNNVTSDCKSAGFQQNIRPLCDSAVLASKDLKRMEDVSIPKEISDRVSTMTLQVSKYRFIVVSCYAPARERYDGNSEDRKRIFTSACKFLKSSLDNAKENEIVIFGGDLNTVIDGVNETTISGCMFDRGGKFLKKQMDSIGMKEVLNHLSKGKLVVTNKSTEGALSGLDKLFVPEKHIDKFSGYAIRVDKKLSTHYIVEIYFLPISKGEKVRIYHGNHE